MAGRTQPYREEDGMPVRLLITGAGSGPSSNLIRSLKAGDPSLFIAGCHSDRFILKKSSADRNFLVHPVTHHAFLRDVARVVARARVDLLIPTTDAEVRALSRARRRLSCRFQMVRSTRGPFPNSRQST